MEAPLKVDAQVIDLSSHNGNVDFVKMASRGVTETIIRATLRVYGVDTFFHRHVEGAKAAGLRVGAYHLWDSNFPALAQVTNFVNTISEVDGVEFAALDVEESRRRTQDDMSVMHKWLWDVSCHLGTNTLIYTSNGLWNQWHNGGPTPWAWNFPLWLADYESVVEPEVVPSDWDVWALWQYSGNGNGAGAYYGTQSHAVDLNVKRKGWGEDE
jgi:lysozyme